jgi:hypothetical protein
VRYFLSFGKALIKKLEKTLSDKRDSPQIDMYKNWAHKKKLDPRWNKEIFNLNCV